MKLQPMPIILSMVLAAVVLFGGWFLYQNVAVASPLQNTVSSIDGIEQATTQVDHDQVQVSMELAEDASLQSVVKEINQRNADLLKQRSLNISITNEGSEALNQWWSQSLFQVAEAMENKKYGEIPAYLEKRAKDLPGLQVHTEMDEQNVYVRLNHEGDSKFILLRRTPAVMAVWSNESIR